MLNLLLKPTKYELVPQSFHHNPLGGHLGYGLANGELLLPRKGELLDTERKIDPIDNPGKLDVSKVRTMSDVHHQNVPFAHHASLILSDWKFCQTNVVKKDLTDTERDKIRERSHRTKTKAGFLSSVLLLITWDLFEKCRRDEIFAYSKYFQVPKGNDLWRVIADSRIAGKLCIKPYPVNFPHIRSIILEIAALGFTYSVIGDFKFWFYQMALSAGLSTLFGIECGEVFCRLRCLPQGWSWSPRIAQCIAWMIILHCEPGESTLGVNEIWTENPPQFIRLKNEEDKVVIGLIFLWLDNILIVTRDPALRHLWYDRLIRNAKIYNARWKHLDECDSPNYLGMHFQMRRKDQQALPQVHWSHEKERIQKWKAILDSSITTARDVAAHVGVIIWHHMVSLEPLYVVKECINVVRRISPKMKFKSWWDKPLNDIDPSLNLSEKEVSVLKRHVKIALRNSLCHVSLNPSTETMYGCTDACKVDQHDLSGPNARKRTGQFENGAGYVLYGPTFALDSKDFPFNKKRWTDAERKLDIYLLELMAIEWMIDFVPFHANGLRLILGCDNTIAVAALNNGYSSSDKACELALSIRKKCKERGIHLELVWVPTKENAADPPSRGLDADDSLNTITWNILHGAPPKTKQTGGEYVVDAKKVGETEAPMKVSELQDDLEEEDDSYEAKILEEFS